MVELNFMLQEYYDLRGWTSEGYVPQSVFEELGIPEIGSVIRVPE
ncbi:MAG: aldehyde ferredoxin oxidoreductase C-terminal domain-containing protein [Promethearchaeota archaeon]